MSSIYGQAVLAVMSIISIGGCDHFFVSGRSVSLVRDVGFVMLPEMLRRSYHKSIAVGSCMAGSLDMIIPKCLSCCLRILISHWKTINR
jgi:TRAP-type C4-dicarboxylate transport system permease large subunit